MPYVNLNDIVENYIKDNVEEIVCKKDLVRQFDTTDVWFDEE